MRCAVKAVVVLAREVLDQEQLETIAARVAELLRTERQRRKLSMSTVAERAGLSQQMVSYVERGMRNPTLDTLLRMAAAMKLDAAELLAAAQQKAVADIVGVAIGSHDLPAGVDPFSVGEVGPEGVVDGLEVVPPHAEQSPTFEGFQPGHKFRPMPDQVLAFLRVAKPASPVARGGAAGRSWQKG